MKKIMFLTLLSFICVACNKIKTTDGSIEEQQNQKEQTKAIGGEKDDHGCISATGETWSELRQTCLRVFEEGLRLDPINTEGEAIISAFVVFNKDQSKVEVFLPQEEVTSIILNKKAVDSYENDIYKFDAKDAVLYINGEKQYAK